MELFTKTQFEKLAKERGNNLVSIYIPTHRSNEEGDANKKDKTHLKNQLKEAEKQLETFGMKESETGPYLEPIEKLLDNTDFWLHNSDGLAIFYQGNEVILYRLPSFFTPYTYVGSHYYMKPLSVMLRDSGRHYILALSLGSVKLYDATQTSIAEVKTSDLMPEVLQDSVGYDYEEKSLQHRTHVGEAGDKAGMYHGHGAGAQTEKKKEALKYFRDVNEGVMKLLHDDDAPLVVACVDYLFPIYKEANTYKHLKNEHVSGNFENKDVLLLKEKAWDIVREDFEKQRRESRKRYHALVNEGKSTAEADKAVPASIGGKTETLFLKRDEKLWGKYHEKEHKIDTSTVRRVGESDLFDLAATHTIMNGGKVYILPEDEMPVPESGINAIFYYDS